MHSQPLCVLGNHVFLASNSVVCTIDLSSSKGEYLVSRISLPLHAPYAHEYRGVAATPDGQLLLTIDRIQSRLTESTAQGKIIYDIILEPHCYPTSVTYAYETFWVSMVVNEFQNQLVRLAPKDEKPEYIILEEDAKTQGLASAGFPLLFNCEGELFLFNDLPGLLYHLDINGQIKSSRRIEEDAVLGPSYDSALIKAVASKGRLVVNRLSVKNASFLYDIKIPIDDIGGICQTENGTIVVVGSKCDDLHIFNADWAGQWLKLLIPLDELMLDAYRNQVRQEKQV